MQRQWKAKGKAVQRQWKIKGKAVQRQWKVKGKAVQMYWTVTGKAVQRQCKGQRKGSAKAVQRSQERQCRTASSIASSGGGGTGSPSVEHRAKAPLCPPSSRSQTGCCALFGRDRAGGSKRGGEMECHWGGVGRRVTGRCVWGGDEGAWQCRAHRWCLRCRTAGASRSERSRRGPESQLKRPAISYKSAQSEGSSIDVTHIGHRGSSLLAAQRSMNAVVSAHVRLPHRPSRWPGRPR